jgi:hypothetical protein
MSTALAEVTLTPELMAQAFWNMGSSQQVRFFEALADAIEADAGKQRRHGQFMAETQWYYLGQDLRSSDKGRDMLMSMAAPLYLHTIRMMEGSL